jgi:hypothetical protein
MTLLSLSINTSLLIFPEFMPAVACTVAQNITLSSSLYIIISNVPACSATKREELVLCRQIAYELTSKLLAPTLANITVRPRVKFES